MKRTFCIKALILALASTLCLASCNDDEETTLEEEWSTVIDNHGTPFSFDENGRPYAAGGIGEDDFNKYIAGYGWKRSATWEIKSDGTRNKTDYYSEMIGASPIHHYFAEDGTGKGFYWSDALPGKVSYQLNWTYSEDGREARLYLSETYYMQIIAWSYDTFCAIVPLGVSSGGVQHYGVSIYRKMSDTELAAYDKEYTEQDLS